MKFTQPSPQIKYSELAKDSFDDVSISAWHANIQRSFARCIASETISSVQFSPSTVQCQHNAAVVLLDVMKQLNTYFTKLEYFSQLSCNTRLSSSHHSYLHLGKSMGMRSMWLTLFMIISDTFITNYDIFLLVIYYNLHFEHFSGEWAFQEICLRSAEWRTVWISMFSSTVGIKEENTSVWPFCLCAQLTIPFASYVIHSFIHAFDFGMSLQELCGSSISCSLYVRKRVDAAAFRSSFVFMHEISMVSLQHVSPLWANHLPQLRDKCASSFINLSLWV